jgi:4-carboxymuconolactone decarboxylase
MRPSAELNDNMGSWGGELRALARLSAAIAAGSEDDVRGAIHGCVAGADPDAVEEVILQSHLFCGFPRCLNAAREWRRISGRPAPAAPVDDGNSEQWTNAGEGTCETVYGSSYRQLRKNVQALHPLLDSWMVEMGYGRVMSRPGLDLRTRELCVVVACAAGGQDRQLHSHLHGALNAGASPEEIDGVLDAVRGMFDESMHARSVMLWKKVRLKRQG